MSTNRSGGSMLHWRFAWILVMVHATGLQAADAEVMRGRIAAYSSGSAFAILDANDKLRRVKLSGVDAPERRQPYAAQAQQLASAWLGGSPFEIQIDQTGADQRIHGRVLRDGRDVGLQLLEAGLAWCDPTDSANLPSQLRDAYSQACVQAKSKQRGLWRDANPTPPWEHRRIPQFDPLPANGRAPPQGCQEIGYQTLQCDDGKTYRIVGSQVLGSDGTVYSRRGNTTTGSDGSRYEHQGTKIYGSDGSVCHTRGRRVDCY